MSNWENLPPELMQLIVRRLSLPDYINFAAVCKSWRSQATKESYKPEKRPPWSMVVTKKSMVVRKKSMRFFPFSEPERRLPRVRGLFMTHFSRGWFVQVGISTKLVLLHIFSGASIELPESEVFLEKLREKGSFRTNHFVLSASPSLSADYILMICFLRSETWAWRSKQRAWRKVGVPPTSRILHLMHYKSQFVALDNHRQMLTLDDDHIANDDVAEVTFTVRMQIDKELFQKFYNLVVECSGSLLLVGGIYDKWPPQPRVVEVDLERGTILREVKSLGNASIFLDEINRESFSVELDNANESVSSLGKVKLNCIYISLRRRGWIYHMNNGHLEEKMLLESGQRHIWIQPSF